MVRTRAARAATHDETADTQTTSATKRKRTSSPPPPQKQSTSSVKEKPKDKEDVPQRTKRTRSTVTVKPMVQVAATTHTTVVDGGDRVREKPARTLYVRNLDERVSTARLRNTLVLRVTAAASARGIVEAVVVRRAPGLRGQAFVRMDSVAAATHVRRVLHGTPFLGAELAVHFARSESRARPC